MKAVIRLAAIFVGFFIFAWLMLYASSSIQNDFHDLWAITRGAAASAACVIIAILLLAREVLR